MKNDTTQAPANGGKLDYHWAALRDATGRQTGFEYVLLLDGHRIGAIQDDGSVERRTLVEHLRQLVAQRAELLEALTLILADHDKCMAAGDQPGFLTVKEETQARAAIAKCQREGGAA